MIVFNLPNLGNAQNCDVAFSLTDANDIEITSTSLTKDGNIIVVGSFKGTNIDFDPTDNIELHSSPNFKNSFIGSYKRDGHLNWLKQIGDNSNVEYKDVILDVSGKIFVCGSCSGSTIDLDPGISSTKHSVPENTVGMAVACYSSTGNYRWGFVVPAEYNLELESYITGKKIDLDNKGNIFICGAFQTSYVDLDPGLEIYSYSTSTSRSNYNDDAFLVKYNQNGNYLWSAAIQSPDSDIAYSLTLDEFGNSYLCGSFSGSNTNFSSENGNLALSSFGETDAFISKYDESGNILWAKKMGGSNMDQANDIKLDADKYVYITGIYKDTADMNPGADINTIISRGKYDCFLAKYNNDGEFVFAKSIGSDENDNAYRLDINNKNEIFLTGYYNAHSNNDFDPNDGVQVLPTNSLSGNHNLYLCSFNTFGSLNWATSGKNAVGIYGSTVLSLPDGNLVLGGRFLGATGSIPTLGDNSFPISDSGKSGIFLATISSSTGIPLIKMNHSPLLIYPNPVTTYIKIKPDDFTETNNILKAQLYNSTGKMIYINNGDISEIETDLNHTIINLTRGNYYLKLYSKNEIWTGRFIKN